jgi:isopentenyl-diphosphate delta-isomerase
MEKVILVAENDEAIGEMEKMEAHKKGLLHRAFSVFIFNTKGELLLQQRALDKYHSGGLWTNTCCSHPRPGENTIDAAIRRLREEMGMETEIQPLFSFIYRAEFDNDLIEHEFDHVFSGVSDLLPIINKDEVASWKYISMEDLTADMETNPTNYTAWFKIIFSQYQKEIYSIV